LDWHCRLGDAAILRLVGALLRKRGAARQEEDYMWLLRRLTVPASESQMAVALGFSALLMSLMLWIIMWQSDVISYQRDVIRWMWTSRFGG
jgi:hypothetical protein